MNSKFKEINDDFITDTVIIDINPITTKDKIKTDNYWF